MIIYYNNYIGGTIRDRRTSTITTHHSPRYHTQPTGRLCLISGGCDVTEEVFSVHDCLHGAREEGGDEKVEERGGKFREREIMGESGGRGDREE